MSDSASTSLPPGEPRRIGPRVDQEDVSLGQAERRALRLLALHEVALAIGGQSDPSHTLELILMQACSLLRAPAGAVYLWEEERGVLRCALAHNTPERLREAAVPPGQGAAGIAFRDCKTVLINNYPSWSGASRLGLELGLAAVVSVPLRVGERLLGALEVHAYERGYAFDEEDAWLLELLGDQAATALEQARLVEQAERRAARLLALHRVSTAISAQANLGATLALILSQTCQLLKRRGGAIYLWDEGSGRLVLTEGHGLPVDQLEASVAPGEDIAGQTWLCRRPVVIDDYQRWPHATPSWKALGLHGVAGIPLIVAGRQLGALVIAAEADGPPFTPEEVQFLELVAGQAAVAIENARLFKAAARARAMDELNRLKSEFISTVSHELRTPLTYIQGYSELLQRRRLGSEAAREAIAEIHNASVRMARLVDDLLDLSRIEAGRLDLRPRELDLAELLKSAVRAARVQAPHLEIQLEIDELPTLVADPDRLRQIIDNLLNNAERYAATSRVIVRARRCDGGVRVDVSDEGPGISPEDQERIFEPFYRGKRSEVLPQRGGGLGLTIVRHLVEAHGGRVGLESAPGRGSTFWFTLPLRARR